MDSNTEDYNLFCEEEQEFMKFAARRSGGLSLDCSTQTMDFLKAQMEEFKDYNKEEPEWYNFPTHDGYLKDMIDFINKNLRPHTKKRKVKVSAADDHPEPSRKRRSNLSPPTPATEEVLNLPRTTSNDSAETLPAPEENHQAAAPVLILKRTLRKSDMCEHQHRLSMPCNQATNEKNFLTKDEIKKVWDKEQIPITVVDPEGRRYEKAFLRRTQAGPKTHSFAIGSPWNTIKKDNGFQEGMEIKIWAIRDPDQKLLILLDRVDG